MQELKMEECAQVSGAGFIPDIGTLLINIAIGAVSGLVFGRPGGMIAGAILGAKTAAGGTMCLDAYEISKDQELQANLKK